MWNLLNSTLGREYPSEARNYMQDMRGEPTDELGNHRKRLRILKIAEEDRSPGEKESIAGAYYEALQDRRKLSRNIQQSRDDGVAENIIKENEEVLREAESVIKNVENYYATDIKLDESLRKKHQINVGPAADKPQRRTRFLEIQKLWKEPTTEGANDDEDQEDSDLEIPPSSSGPRQSGEERQRRRGGRPGQI